MTFRVWMGYLGTSVALAALASVRSEAPLAEALWGLALVPLVLLGIRRVNERRRTRALGAHGELANRAVLVGEASQMTLADLRTATRQDRLPGTERGARDRGMWPGVLALTDDDRVWYLTEHFPALEFDLSGCRTVERVGRVSHIGPDGVRLHTDAGEFIVTTYGPPRLSTTLLQLRLGSPADD